MPTNSKSIENSFPNIEVSQIAEQESWRKEINRPLYHIHKWWATRLGSVFRAITLASLSEEQENVWAKYYKINDFKGKVVLDPFMGSGTTLGESIKLGAKAIGCDINPISTFLVQQAFTRVDIYKLKTIFTNLEQKLSKEILHYYQTRDPETGILIPVLYFFWVKIVTTPDGEDIPLFSRYIFSQNAYPKLKPKAQIFCPKCWQILESTYNTTGLECNHCKHFFNPQLGPANGQFVTSAKGVKYKIKDLITSSGKPPSHRLYAILALKPNGEKIYLPAREEDFALYKEAEIRLESEVLPLPTMSVRAGHNTEQARRNNYLQWRDFFNTRQLLCLGLLLREILNIDDVTIQEQFLCLFSSTLEFNNLFCSFKGEGTGAVRHMFSNHILKPERTPIENSIWGVSKSSGTFSTLFESRLLKAKQYLDEPFEVGFNYDLFGNRSGAQKHVASKPINVKLVNTWKELSTQDTGLMVINGNSSSLPIPALTVDAVITDPPYFDFVHYSELSDFFFSWLAPVLQNRYEWFRKIDSSDKGEVQHKEPLVFSKLLSNVFSECHRVLKEDGVLVFSFHHSRPEGWAAIYSAVVESGFQIVAAHPVYAELRAASPKNAAKNPISIDSLLVCKKIPYNKSNIINTDSITTEFIVKFTNAGINLSSSDIFVIKSSLALVRLSGENIAFENLCNLLPQNDISQENLVQPEPIKAICA